MNNSKIRLGIVGVGRIAEEVHLPVLKRMPEAEIVAICDREPQRLEKMRRLFKIDKGYMDIATMLKEQKLNVVDICTPPGNHKELCLEALNAGVNVIVEKPFTTNVADADMIISTARQKHLLVHVIHNQSYLPLFLKAKEILHSGELGEIINVNVKMTLPFEKEWLDPENWASRIPGGPLGEVAPHAVMLFLEFLDTNSVDEVHAVAANANGYSSLKADQMIMTVRAGNRIGSCCVSSAPVDGMTIEVEGSKNSLFVDGVGQIIIKTKPIRGGDTLARGIRVLSDFTQRMSCALSAATNVALGRYKPGVPLGHMYLFRESIKEIRGEGVYPISLEQVREKVRILEIAFKQLDCYHKKEIVITK